MKYSDIQSYKEAAKRYAHCFTRGNNCRIVREKEQECLRDILQAQTNSKRCKNHQYVAGYKTHNFGTRNYPDIGKIVVFAKTEDECKTSKNKFRTKYDGFISPENIIGYF